METAFCYLGKVSIVCTLYIVQSLSVQTCRIHRLKILPCYWPTLYRSGQGCTLVGSGGFWVVAWCPVRWADCFLHSVFLQPPGQCKTSLCRIRSGGPDYLVSHLTLHLVLPYPCYWLCVAFVVLAPWVQLQPWLRLHAVLCDVLPSIVKLYGRMVNWSPCDAACRLHTPPWIRFVLCSWQAGLPDIATPQ